MVLNVTQVAGLTSAALAIGATLGFLAAQRLFQQQQSDAQQQRMNLQNATTTPSEPGTRRRRCDFPKRLILVRHGESEGNIDPLLYCRVPDNAMHLTDLGYEQAVAAGRSIKEIVGDESMRFIVSPYVRTIETFQGIKQAWPKAAAHAIPWSEEPRIREQDFGNFQEPLKIRECKAQRRRFGSFFYRFPSGESPADVFDRVSSFLESLHRMFEKSPERNYVLVTHGVAIRVILTRYFKYRISEFEQMANFHNGEFVVLEYDDARGKYALAKVVHNDVVMRDDGRVSTTTTEARTIRLHEDSCQSAIAMPYPTSPVNHFRRTSMATSTGQQPPPPPLTETSTISSNASLSPRADPEEPPEFDCPEPLVVAGGSGRAKSEVSPVVSSSKALDV